MQLTFEQVKKSVLGVENSSNEGETTSWYPYCCSSSKRGKAPHDPCRPYKSISSTEVAYISLPHPHSSLCLGRKPTLLFCARILTVMCPRQQHFPQLHLFPSLGLWSSRSLRRELGQKEELYSQEPPDIWVVPGVLCRSSPWFGWDLLLSHAGKRHWKGGVLTSCFTFF